MQHRQRKRWRHDVQTPVLVCGDAFVTDLGWGSMAGLRAVGGAPCGGEFPKLRVGGKALSGDGAFFDRLGGG
jgi:hypothetical protein